MTATIVDLGGMEKNANGTLDREITMVYYNITVEQCRDDNNALLVIRLLPVLS